MSQLGYPGIGRIAYVLWTVLLYAVMIIGFLAAFWYAAQDSVGGSDELFERLWNSYALFVYLAIGILMIALEVLRLRNLGMSGWWVLGKCVPIFYPWLLWRMFACPGGYADHKQLDLPGKILTGLLLLLFGLPVALALLALLLSSLHGA